MCKVLLSERRFFVAGGGLLLPQTWVGGCVVLLDSFIGKTTGTYVLFAIYGNVINPKC
jgi:hypothetical protein